MAHRVCPWWLGYFLISPIRRWMTGNAGGIVAPYVKKGMTVLEPGPGMGFFTLELARMVGAEGRVIAVDVQPKMIAKVKQRASRAGLLSRIDARVTSADSLGIADLANRVDFVLAFAVVHEFPSPQYFFSQAAEACKPGASVLLAEPAGHVDDEDFQAELQDAAAAGLSVVSRPTIRRSHAAVLKKGSS